MATGNRRRVVRIAVLATGLCGTFSANARPFVNVFLEEDEYCGGSVASVATPVPVVVVRKIPKAPQHRDADGFALVRLTIDAEGYVSSTELLAERPERRNFARSATSALERWKFAEGRPGFYCVGVTFDYILPGESYWAPPWDPPGMPMAPKPVYAEPAPPLPAEAVADAAECVVELSLRIDQDGAVAQGVVLSETPEKYRCGSPARDAVLNWRFPPDTKPGRYKLRLRVVP